MIHITVLIPVHVLSCVFWTLKATVKINISLNFSNKYHTGGVRSFIMYNN